jgi:hypothetical protein
LGNTSYTGITDDTDRETSRQPSETDRETGTELNEPGVERHRGFQVSRDQNRND